MSTRRNEEQGQHNRLGMVTVRMTGNQSGGARLNRPFFPVSKVGVHATDTGHTFRGHWAIVSDDRGAPSATAVTRIGVNRVMEADSR